MKKETRRDTHYAPWICKECGSWVFTIPSLHRAVCRQYQDNPEMVLSNKRYYESMLEDKPVVAPAKGARKKRSGVAKNTGI